MSQITKKALAASLKKLILEKPFNKITINDITNYCGINRMTFYYHFQNIYSLMEWTITEDLKISFEGTNTYDTWEKRFVDFFIALKKQKTFMKKVFKSINREHVEKYLSKYAFKLVLDVVNEKTENTSLTQEEKEFIAAFYKCAFVGMIIDWIDEDMKNNPELIVKRIGILVKGDIDKGITYFCSLPNTSNL